MEHCARAEPECFGIGLECATHVDELARFAVSNHDGEIVVDEEVNFTELDGLELIVVDRRLENHEERAVVGLQLWALVGLDGVFDGEFVEVVLPTHRLELCLVRLVESDPGEGTRSTVSREGALEFERLGFTHASLIVGGIDDHARGASK